MAALLELQGVGVPTASVLLYFAFPDDYPILDVRGLESLGTKPRSQYPISFWLDYLDACRELARRYRISLRTLDKALWQHSKERSKTARPDPDRHPRCVSPTRPGSAPPTRTTGLRNQLGKKL